MRHRLVSRLFAFVSLLVFATASGGEQFADAVVFHGHPSPAPLESRMHAVDHCHAERCVLGVPVVASPPATRWDPSRQLVVPTHYVASLLPAETPRSNRPVPGHGSRAPPALI